MDYFNAYRNLKLSRDDKGVLVAELHCSGGLFLMDAQSHTELGEAFQRIGEYRANKIFILTGAGGEFITDVEATRAWTIYVLRGFSTFSLNALRRLLSFFPSSQVSSEGFSPFLRWLFSCEGLPVFW
jgi:hypothetical protein